MNGRIGDDADQEKELMMKTNQTEQRTRFPIITWWRVLLVSFFFFLWHAHFLKSFPWRLDVSEYRSFYVFLEAHEGVKTEYLSILLCFLLKETFCGCLVVYRHYGRYGFKKRMSKMGFWLVMIMFFGKKSDDFWVVAVVDKPKRQNSFLCVSEV